MAARRVLVTRAAHQAGKLSDALRAAGFEPVEVPVLEIQPPLDYAPLDAALRSINSYDWLIFTSANAVRAFADRAAAMKLASNEIKQLKIAAVGEATAEAARQAGFEVAIVPEKYVAESLIDELLQLPGISRNVSRTERSDSDANAWPPEGGLRGQRFLVARAEVARDVIPDALRDTGAEVNVVDAYRNVMPETAPALLRTALQQGIEAATFTSSSSVTHLADAARAAGIPFPFTGVKAISIGPITSATLREHGWPPAAEASPSDISGLVAAISSINYHP